MDVRVIVTVHHVQGFDIWSYGMRFFPLTRDRMMLGLERSMAVTCESGKGPSGAEVGAAMSGGARYRQVGDKYGDKLELKRDRAA